MYSHQQLERFVFNVFLKMGHSQEDAATGAKVLISADLRGVDSHGIARLSGYVRLWEKDRVNANPNIRIVHETPSTAVVDGDRGLGLIVGPAAMRIALDKAEKVGSSWVAVRNSNHYGIAGYHAMMASAEDKIGFAMTNASPLVSPTFSTERLLGTNPIAVAIPSANHPPFVADLATTPAANGKLEVLARKGEQAPAGWIQKKDGSPSQNPLELKDGGALVPLGSDRMHGSHKGYCLGSVVDILSGVLSGANYGPWVPPFVGFLDVGEESVGEGLGHIFGAMRIDAFRPKEEFLSHMDRWIERFQQAEAIPGEKVIIPGEPEYEIARQREKEGIPLLDSVVADLKSLSEKFEVNL